MSSLMASGRFVFAMPEHLTPTVKNKAAPAIKHVVQQNIADNEPLDYEAMVEGAYNAIVPDLLEKARMQGWQEAKADSEEVEMPAAFHQGIGALREHVVRTMNHDQLMAVLGDAYQFDSQTDPKWHAMYENMATAVESYFKRLLLED